MRLLLSIAFTFVLGIAAHASTVNWHIDGEFKNNHGGYIYDGGDKFKWGYPHSKLKITEYKGPEDLGIGHFDVHLLDITWYNATSLTLPNQRVDLHIDLNWSGADSASETFRLDVTNTKDFDFCWHCHPKLKYDPQDDKISAFVLDAHSFGGVPLDLGHGVSVEGYEWVLGEGSDGTFVDGHWYNSEHGKSTLQLKAKVSVVPLPAAGWMLIAGLGGLAAMSRRRKAQAA